LGAAWLVALRDRARLALSAAAGVACVFLAGLGWVRIHGGYRASLWALGALFLASPLLRALAPAYPRRPRVRAFVPPLASPLLALALLASARQREIVRAHALLGGDLARLFASAGLFAEPARTAVATDDDPSGAGLALPTAPRASVVIVSIDAL